jgi:hypothetical protein
LELPELEGLIHRHLPVPAEDCLVGAILELVGEGSVDCALGSSGPHLRQAAENNIAAAAMAEL